MYKSRKLAYELGRDHARQDEVSLTANQFRSVITLFMLIETVTSTFDELWMQYQVGFLSISTYA